MKLKVLGVLSIRTPATFNAVPSSTLINGHFAIRVANANHRTCQEDFDLLLASVLNIEKDILESASGSVK